MKVLTRILMIDTYYMLVIIMPIKYDNFIETIKNPHIIKYLCEKWILNVINKLQNYKLGLL